MHAAAGVVRNEKQEMLDLLRAMVQKKGSIEVEKLKMVEKEKKERGELSYIYMTIELINPPKVELTGATSVVPENIVRNINAFKNNAFKGVKSDYEDLD